MQAVMERVTENSPKAPIFEPRDADWGVGVTSMGDTHSPFERVNRLRKLTFDT